jgi:hypothetical protein
MQWVKLKHNKCNNKLLLNRKHLKMTVGSVRVALLILASSVATVVVLNLLLKTQVVGLVPAVLLIKVNSVVNVVRRNLRMHLFTNAINAVGNLLILRIRLASARNVATFSMMQINNKFFEV